ncbi:MAG: hypothetical protein ACMUIE_10860, partial [Thermoplasmatota archaeon]
MGIIEKGENLIGQIPTGPIIGNLKLFNKGEQKKVGQPPGTLIFMGEKKTEKVTVQMIEYDAEDFSEFAVKDVVNAIRNRKEGKVSWINVNGLHDVELLSKIGDFVGIHPLVQ